MYRFLQAVSNPYRKEKNDSVKGDCEIETMIELFDCEEADFILIGMDSNVTSLHPRFKDSKRSWLSNRL